jgi:hypothetical protein
VAPAGYLAVEASDQLAVRLVAPRQHPAVRSGLRPARGVRTLQRGTAIEGFARGLGQVSIEVAEIMLVASDLSGRRFISGAGSDFVQHL